MTGTRNHKKQNLEWETCLYIVQHMLSSIPKMNRTAKEIILIQKMTSVLHLQLFSVSEHFFSSSESVILFTCAV